MTTDYQTTDDNPSPCLYLYRARDNHLAFAQETATDSPVSSFAHLENHLDHARRHKNAPSRGRHDCPDRLFRIARAADHRRDRCVSDVRRIRRLGHSGEGTALCLPDWRRHGPLSVLPMLAGHRDWIHRD
jgi:hypothetical protein